MTDLEPHRQLLKDFPVSKWADISSYKLGYLEYDKRNLDLAIPLFEEHLKNAQSRHADEARYFMGWSLLKLGKYNEASHMFTEVQTKHFRSSLSAGAAFWHAYILKQSGKDGEAKQGFEYVVKTWPTSGYAWQAGLYIDIAYPTVALVSLDTAPYNVLPEELDVPAFHTGRALAEVGFESLAAAQLRSLSESVKDDRNINCYLHMP